MSATPRFAHDHDCEFLGRYRDTDLYWCDQGGFLPTVIARFSSDRPDYTSGMALAEHHPYLAEAKRRAEARGLRTSPAQTPSGGDA